MTALVTTAIIILLVVVVGFYAGRNKSSRSNIEEWSVGGRNFGGLLIWFLIGADVYTAYTFLGLTGYGYSLGAAAFFAVPYVVLAYPIAYYILPRIWEYASKHRLTTLADYTRERFQSKTLGVLVALTGIIFLIPYIDLQLSGITGVVDVAGKGVFVHPHAVGIAALVVSFILVALYTFFSGLRAPAWTSLIKDALVWIIMVVMVISVPFILFGSWGNMWHTAVTKFPQTLTLHAGAHGNFWFMTSALISALALFMWPHASTGALSSRNADILRKNAVFLPFYNILLFFITFLGIVFGVAIGSQLAQASFGPPRIMAPTALPAWTMLLAVAVSSLAAVVIMRAQPRDTGWVVLGTAIAYGAASLGALALGPLGAFLGALALGVASNVFSALRNRPALVMQAPGLLILVPGSIGYHSLAALLQSNTLTGVQAAFQMFLVGAALVYGLLFANLISPNRDLLRVIGSASRRALGRRQQQ